MSLSCRKPCNGSPLTLGVKSKLISTAVEAQMPLLSSLHHLLLFYSVATSTCFWYPCPQATQASSQLCASAHAVFWLTLTHLSQSSPDATSSRKLSLNPPPSVEVSDPCFCSSGTLLITVLQHSENITSRDLAKHAHSTRCHPWHIVRLKICWTELVVE